MKFLLDMNLSPAWVGHLARHGLESVHWSAVGTATAPDAEVLAWARDHEFVVLTNDLDFSAILAASSGHAPSVVQLRTQDLLSEDVVKVVVQAIETFRAHVDAGALLSIDEGRTRVRMLPLRRS